MMYRSYAIKKTVVVLVNLYMVRLWPADGIVFAFATDAAHSSSMTMICSVNYSLNYYPKLIINVIVRDEKVHFRN